MLFLHMLWFLYSFGLAFLLAIGFRSTILFFAIGLNLAFLAAEWWPQGHAAWWCIAASMYGLAYLAGLARPDYR